MSMMKIQENEQLKARIKELEERVGGFEKEHKRGLFSIGSLI